MPGRTLQAFVRGRRARNLYHLGLADGALGEMTVGTLRTRLGVRRRTVTARSSDVVAFIAWCVIAVTYHAVATAVGLVAAWLVWVRFRR